MATTHQSSQQTKSNRARWPEMSSHDVNMNENERMFSMVAGGALVLWGLSRMPKGMLVLMAGGAYAIYRGMNGHCHIYEQLGIDHGGD